MCIMKDPTVATHTDIKGIQTCTIENRYISAVCIKTSPRLLFSKSSYHPSLYSEKKQGKHERKSKMYTFLDWSFASNVFFKMRPAQKQFESDVGK